MQYFPFVYFVATHFIFTKKFTTFKCVLLFYEKSFQ